ncbi:hypothetical protein FD755_021769, partial [Muntiacus reevesi]
VAEEDTAAGRVTDLNTARQEALRTALILGGLARGIREAAKASDKRQAHLHVLASNWDEPRNVKSAEALCAEHQFSSVQFSRSASVKLTEREKPHKVVGCSCVVVKDYGKESQPKNVIEEHFKCKK